MVDVIGWRLDDVVALIKGPKGQQGSTGNTAGWQRDENAYYHADA
ncbi:Tail-specific protease precursor [Salmonella enterica subsp. enterica]|nr:Tail-specific protease precursor [Salmonella enterica subsp. enterica]